MGEVAVLFKVYADSGQEDKVGNEIKEQLKPQAMQFEEVAFGIKVIKVMFVHSDTSGSSEIEEMIKKIPGVNEVEIAEETLI